MPALFNGYSTCLAGRLVYMGTVTAPACIIPKSEIAHSGLFSDKIDILSFSFIPDEINPLAK